jgi:N-acetylglucosaminyldiphosphoundecaprenol N-acetyl-beta-D-mannosaminyltransferase
LRATTNIFGFDFICDASYEQLAYEIINEVDRSDVGITNFITPNAHGINVYARLPELNRFCQSSRYVLPDGQPIVWLSRLTRHPIKKRLTGSDFFPVIFNKLKEPRHKCLFVVSNDIIKQAFRNEKPDALCLVPEFFKMEETEKVKRIGGQIADLVAEHALNYVFIGISEPKQGALAKEATQQLKARNYTAPCIFFFLGASYEFYFGLKKRAPVFFQKYGLEWFYRLMLEPKRMFGRYVIGNFMFILRSVKWALTRQREPKQQ